MKVVVNRCYGGFGLSPQALQEIAKRQGRECYFFKYDHEAKHYAPITVEKAKAELCAFAFDIPNPNEVFESEANFREWSEAKHQEQRDLWDKHQLDSRWPDRSDPLLVAVVEELGKAADGWAAELEVVEIPDGTEYEIEEYDGKEWISEVHRRW